MKNLKELLNNIEAAEKAANEANDALDLENPTEEAEQAFDVAYKKEWEAFEELTKALEEVTGGKIDTKTASQMIRGRREDLKRIINLYQ